MLLELLKNYADMINSATRMTQRSATAMARTMLIQAGMEPAADMVSKLSEQMIAAQDAHYAMMRRMVQAEVDMTAARMGALSIGRVAEEEATSETTPEREQPLATLKVVKEPDAPKAASEPADESAGSAKAEPEEPILKSVRQTPDPATEDVGTKDVAQKDIPQKDEPKKKEAAKPEPAEAGGTAEQNAETSPAMTATKEPAKRTTARKTTARKTAVRKSTAAKSTSPAKSDGTGSSAAKSTKAAVKAPTKSTTTRSTRKASSSGDAAPEAQS